MLMNIFLVFIAKDPFFHKDTRFVIERNEK